MVGTALRQRKLSSCSSTEWSGQCTTPCCCPGFAGWSRPPLCRAQWFSHCGACHAPWQAELDAGLVRLMGLSATPCLMMWTLGRCFGRVPCSQILSIAPPASRSANTLCFSVASFAQRDLGAYMSSEMDLAEALPRLPSIARPRPPACY